MNDKATKPDTVRANFDEISKTYSDENRRKVIPCFDDLYSSGVSILTTEKTNPRILDLGAGTGLYASFLFNRYPGAVLSLIDFAGGMTEIAKQRFSMYDDVTYIIGDYMTADIDGAFDIIISALSIHHLNAGGKAALFRRVHDWLNPGGEFLNADQIQSTNSAIQNRYEELWFSYVKDHGLTQEQIARMRQSMALDDPSPIVDQIAWLREAGFIEAECVYKHWNFAVLYAKKRHHPNEDLNRTHARCRGQIPQSICTCARDTQGI
jgi:tRNA (cmo5U34)-methyltransferase